MVVFTCPVADCPEGKMNLEDLQQHIGAAHKGNFHLFECPVGGCTRQFLSPVSTFQHFEEAHAFRPSIITSVKLSKADVDKAREIQEDATKAVMNYVQDGVIKQESRCSPSTERPRAAVGAENFFTPGRIFTGKEYDNDENKVDNCSSSGEHLDFFRTRNAKDAGLPTMKREEFSSEILVEKKTKRKAAQKAQFHGLKKEMKDEQYEKNRTRKRKCGGGNADSEKSLVKKRSPPLKAPAEANVLECGNEFCKWERKSIRKPIEAPSPQQPWSPVCFPPLPRDSPSRLTVALLFAGGMEVKKELPARNSGKWTAEPAILTLRLSELMSRAYKKAETEEHSCEYKFCCDPTATAELTKCFFCKGSHSDWHCGTVMDFQERRSIYTSGLICCRCGCAKRADRHCLCMFPCRFCPLPGHPSATCYGRDYERCWLRLKERSEAVRLKPSSWTVALRQIQLTTK